MDLSPSARHVLVGLSVTSSGANVVTTSVASSMTTAHLALGVSLLFTEISAFGSFFVLCSLRESIGTLVWTSTCSQLVSAAIRF